MLVLGRFPDESITIGENTLLTVRDVYKDQIRFSMGKILNGTENMQEPGQPLKVGQKVYLSTDVVLTLVRIELHGRVGLCAILGFQAPKRIPIHRKELYDELLAAGRDKLTLVKK